MTAGTWYEKDGPGGGRAPHGFGPSARGGADPYGRDSGYDRDGRHDRDDGHG
ncbi:hypothetical protein G3I42_34570, partial [Streptomyces sp. SID11385]|nr:hypothetical protein [Streptomyces sp. SID11385]